MQIPNGTELTGGFNDDIGVDASGLKQTRTRFTVSEDNLLISLYNSGKYKTWEEIAQNIPGKSARQCRDRWNYCLSPEINNNPWTPEEDELIIMKVKEIGRKWSVISTYFEGRSDVAIRNRYNQTLQFQIDDPVMSQNEDVLSLPSDIIEKVPSQNKKSQTLSRRKMMIPVIRSEVAVQTDSFEGDRQKDIFISRTPSVIPFPVPVFVDTKGNKISGAGQLNDEYMQNGIRQLIQQLTSQIEAYGMFTNDQIPHK